MTKPTALFAIDQIQSDSNFSSDDEKSQTPIPHSGGINAPIGAVRPFRTLLSPSAKNNSKTCPNIFESFDCSEVALKNNLPLTSPKVSDLGIYAPLPRQSYPKRRHSI